MFLVQSCRYETCTVQNKKINLPVQNSGRYISIIFQLIGKYLYKVVTLSSVKGDVRVLKMDGSPRGWELFRAILEGQLVSQ